MDAHFCRFCLSYLMIFTFAWGPQQAHSESFADEAVSSYFDGEPGFLKLLEILKLEDGVPQVRVVKSEDRVQPSSGYFVQSIELGSEQLPSFKIHVRHPQNQISETPRPVIFVMSGLESDAATLDLFPRNENAVYVVFEYDIDKSSSLEMIKDLPDVLEFTTAQAAAAMQWVLNQKWASLTQFQTMGVSLGTLFLPLTQRVVQHYGTEVGATILAYGGADLAEFLKLYLRTKLGRMETRIAMEILTPLLRPFDPLLHLPKLKSQFLIIRGTEDQIIPVASSEALIAATPDPKEVIMIPGGHINVDQWDIIEQMGSAVEVWLQKQGRL